MPWAAAAAVASAAIGAGSSLYASGQQQKGAQNAIDTQSGIFNTIRNDLAPYNQAGVGATNQLSSYFGIGNGGPGGGYNEVQGAAPGMGGGGRLTGQAAAAALGPTNNLFTGHGNTALQDIQQALIKGIPISDASWAKAGLPPGGGNLLNAPAQPIQQQVAPVQQAPVQMPVADQASQPGGLIPSPNANNAFAQLQNYPGYQFQYDQGLQALNRNLTAGGRYTSGAMVKDAQAYGQGFAQNSITNYLDMLKFLGTLGANSGAQVGSLGTTAGQGMASSQMGQGTAAAAGTMGAANALGGLFQNSSFQGLFGGGGGKATYDTASQTWTPGAGGF